MNVNTIKIKLTSIIVLTTMFLSWYNSVFADYTKIQQYYKDSQDKVFNYIKDTNVSFENGWNPTTTSSTWTSWFNSTLSWATWSGEFIGMWYDDYYADMKSKEFEERRSSEKLLWDLKNNVMVNDSKINQLSKNVNKIYADNSYYAILGVRFVNTTYFTFWDNYIVLFPYTISGNKEYFDAEIKWNISNTLKTNEKNGLDVQYQAVKQVLDKYGIKYYLFNKVDTEHVKLYMWESRNAKMMFENQPFFSDKWYKMEVLPAYNDSDFVIYTIVNKEDLEKNNILQSTSVISKIQPYIKIWDINISLDYFWDSGYTTIWKNGNMKIVDYGIKKEYVVEKNNSVYFFIVIWSILFFLIWILANWFYYQKKYKPIFMKISEGRKKTI